MDRLETPQLLLRPPRDSDVGHLYPVVSDPTAMAHFGPERPLTREETGYWITNHESLRETEGFAPWMICLSENDEVVGWGGLSRDSRDESPANELLYIIGRDYWGRGMGLELVQAALVHAIDQLELIDVIGRVRPENVWSARILERAGMTCTGRDATGWDRYEIDREQFKRRRRGGHAN